VDEENALLAIDVPEHFPPQKSLLLPEPGIPGFELSLNPGLPRLFWHPKAQVFHHGHLAPTLASLRLFFDLQIDQHLQGIPLNVSMGLWCSVLIHEGPTGCLAVLPA
jgi:hypothetical protein